MGRPARAGCLWQRLVVLKALPPHLIRTSQNNSSSGSSSTSSGSGGSGGSLLEPGVLLDLRNGAALGRECDRKGCGQAAQAPRATRQAARQLA